jgi:hypothetical protein
MSRIARSLRPEVRSPGPPAPEAWGSGSGLRASDFGRSVMTATRSLGPEVRSPGATR